MFGPLKSDACIYVNHKNDAPVILTHYENGFLLPRRRHLGARNYQGEADRSIQDDRHGRCVLFRIKVIRYCDQWTLSTTLDNYTMFILKRFSIRHGGV